MLEAVSLLISSGNGPVECRLAVAHVLGRIEANALDLGLSVDIAERAGGKGLASAIVTLHGARAHQVRDDWLGTVQWRCPSPVRAKHKRKNWFVQVFALCAAQKVPQLRASDVTMQAIRAGGPGGQHQNKTSSAIRAQWSGYCVVVHDQRSQHRNRKLALERLAHLAALDEAVAQKQVTADTRKLHYSVQRGGATRYFEGPDFREVPIPNR